MLIYLYRVYTVLFSKNIIINKNLSQYKRRKTLIHELAHTELAHLVQHNKNLFAFFIQDYENEADDYIKELLKGM